MAKTFYQEHEGSLYRGERPYHPTEVWDFDAGKWVPYLNAGRAFPDEPITEKQFEIYRDEIAKVLAENEEADD